MDCYDSIAEKILHHFYPEDIENNIKIYHNYTRSVLAAYGVLYCSDKYNNWAGTTCNQETQAKGLEIIKQYILDLIEQMKTNVQKWEFIKNYKR